MITYLPDGLAAPRPQRDGLDTSYWEGLAKGLLRVQRCKACGTWRWGPEWICHSCRSFDVGWVEVDPKGHIYSWARAWHPVHPALRERGPYIFALIELPHAGAVRMIGNLLGDAKQDVAIGGEVVGVFEKHETEKGTYTLLQWRPL
jgi:uncharacterized OB-fold protein